MSRNRTRAEREAAGLVAVEVALAVEDRAAIDTEAKEQGLSRAGLVAKWAKSLAKKHARKNRLVA